MRMKWLETPGCWAFDNGQVAVPFKGGLKFVANYRPMHPKGYLQFKLHQRNYRVHNIIASAFLAPQPNCVVDHIDRNRLNNAVENLRYISQKENSYNCLRSDISKDKYGAVSQSTEYRKNYYAQNREAILGKKKAYRDSLPPERREEIKEYMKNYRAAKKAALRSVPASSQEP